MSVKYKGSQNNKLCDCATYVGIVSQYELSAREVCVTLHQITVSARICTGCGFLIETVMFAKAPRASDSAAAFLICQRVQLHHILFKQKEKEKLHLLYMKEHILIVKKSSLQM